ncbi:IPT/TIG domain-containing protein [Geobacter sp. AOG1]|uniref:IPT/TIG domain-containing protein n=1 Tax=Geobacter sp. AOG1 TaxID=1566346 RepID=UPI001CC71999|nr:IPT/TIG domain-containing protein [Geobacter sp. AOG1]GFE59350.1 transcription factor [Geobacter sp. AOG1]
MSIRFVVAAVLLLMAIPAAGKQLAQKSTNSKPASQDTRPAISILSIVPTQGEPGNNVTLSGAGFSDKTTVFLGSNEIQPRVTGAKQLNFDIPKLAPGLYAIYLHREDGTTSKTYSFTVAPLKPVALSLSPDTVQSCATGRERDVTLTGRNFQEGSQVLFDGAVIASRFGSEESLSFTAPSVVGGLHQIQVKNPEETTTVPLALMINSRPEVTSVSQGEDFVSYYELVIEGRNFQQSSMVTIDGKRLGSGEGPAGERERLIFYNCNRLVYERHPYDSTSKGFRLQVVNQNGEESAVVQVTAP